MDGEMHHRTCGRDLLLILKPATLRIAEEHSPRAVKKPADTWLSMLFTCTGR
jgi:hypothetical protein